MVVLSRDVVLKHLVLMTDGQIVVIQNPCRKVMRIFSGQGPPFRRWAD